MGNYTHGVSILSSTPGNSHPNGTVKPNAYTNCKQMVLKTTDNYVNAQQLCFMSLLNLFYSISTPTINISLSHIVCSLVYVVSMRRGFSTGMGRPEPASGPRTALFSRAYSFS